MNTNWDNPREPLFSSLAVDPELGELVSLFVLEMPDRITAIRQQVQERDWEGLRRSAHQLKGAAGSYGFERISPSASRLEYALRDELTEETVLRAAEELIDLCRRARGGVPEEVESR
jgi:histidine phosphotransfer protein HptB